MWTFHLYGLKRRSALSLIFAGFFLIHAATAFAQSQPFTPRSEFNQRLEPKGVVMHGAGQVIWETWYGGYVTYQGQMDNQSRPYLSSEWLPVTWNWSDEIARWQSYYDDYGWEITLLIAVPLVDQMDDVAAGRYDTEIQNMCDALKAYGRPVYLRPGFEFNGWWNHYTNTVEYIQAWIRIANAIRSNGLENVALVWDYAVDGDAQFMPWYPGDEYVDWWGLNVWSPDQFTSGQTRAFLDAASAHRKPVMLCETTPRGYYTQNSGTWNNWFVPYYNFIRTEPTIKGFIYINWDWTQTLDWSDWGDARVENNAWIAGNMRNEMHHSWYLNAPLKGSPVSITTTSLLGATTGSAYTAPIATSGGTTPFTWSISAGSLSPGLSLDATNGVISGTPTSTGTFNFTVVVADSGSPSTSDTQNLSIVVAPQNIPPTAYIDSATSSTGAAPLTVAFSGHGQDTAGPLQHEWSFGDGTPVVTYTGMAVDAASTPSHTYTNAGTYVCTLTVSDPQSVSASQSVTITVTPPPDSKPPTCSITSFTNGNTVSGTITVSAGASDDVGVTRVELYADGVLIGADTGAPYSFSWNTTSVPNGNHDLQARAYDAARNVGASSVLTVTVDNTADTTGPTMSFLSPENGQVVKRRITVSVSASDSSGVGRVEFYLNGVLKSTDSANPWEWSWDTRPYRGQTVTVTAKGYDTLGNMTTISVTVRVR